MAKLKDLIKQIPDAKLYEEIACKVAAQTSSKCSGRSRLREETCHVFVLAGIDIFLYAFDTA